MPMRGVAAVGRRPAVRGGAQAQAAGRGAVRGPPRDGDGSGISQSPIPAPIATRGRRARTPAPATRTLYNVFFFLNLY